MSANLFSCCFPIMNRSLAERRRIHLESSITAAESSATTKADTRSEKYNFKWTVENFSSLTENFINVERSKLSFAKALMSPVFTTGNGAGIKMTSWALVLHPSVIQYRKNLETSINELVPYVGLHLHIKKKGTKIRMVECMISLVNAEGGKFNSKKMRSFFVDDHFLVTRFKHVQGVERYATKDFAKRCNGWRDFISREALLNEDSALLPNNRLVVTCDMKVYYKSIITSSNSMDKSVLYNSNPHKLARDLKVQYDEQKCCDVSLRCGETVFRAHKAILSARSPVFASMFEHDLLENRNHQVEIEDVEDPVMKAMLDYMYGGDINELSLEACLGLYTAADKYIMPDLKRNCGIILTSTLSTANVCTVASLAELYNDQELFGMAKKFVKANSVQLMITRDWIAFVQKRPDLAASLVKP